MPSSIASERSIIQAETAQALPDHIPSLDGLRAVSVVLVIAGHAALYGPATRQWKLFSSLFLNSEIGVTWFFVISGFLITALLLREQARTNSISLSRFYLRRALRILPPFYVLVLTVLMLKYFGGLAIPGQRIWTSATFTYNIVKHPPYGSWWLGHTWSLSVEEQFYLCWPLLLILLGAKRARLAAGVLIVLAPLFRLALLLRYPDFANQISGLLPSRMDGLMLGSLAALCYGSPVLHRWLSKLSVPVLFLLAAFPFVLSPLFSYELGNRYLFSIGFTLESFCLLVILLFAVSRPASKLGAMLNAASVAFVGVLSYDIYLWQQLFMTPNNTTITGLPGINLVCIGVCAFLSYKFIEGPCRRLSRHLLQQSASAIKALAQGN